MKSEPVHTGEGARWHRVIVWLVDAACRHPALVLAAAAIVCALSLYGSATRLEYHTDRSDLISPHKDYQQRWRAYLSEFGDDDDIVFVVQRRGTADRAMMVGAIESLADKLAARSDRFDRLFFKADLHGLRNRALLLLPAAHIEKIQTSLQSMKPLLELGPVGWRALNVLSLLHEARMRVMALPDDRP
jgi:hypothetical protein